MTAICVLRHVVPADWPDFVRELRRVVRPGGLVGVIEHNPLNPLTRLAVARCTFDREAVLLRAGRIEVLMAQAGFGAVGSRYFLLLPSAAPWARCVERACRNLPFSVQYATCGSA